MNIQKFNFNDAEIEFDLRQGKNMMVNATEMAKAFGKEVARFMENDSTKNFIDACLKTRNSSFLGVESRDDLVTSKQRSGTWMHRILALKFAAWLSADFEVWVYLTIDQLLFGFATEIEDSISESVKLEKRKNALMNKLAKESAEFNEILEINQELERSKNRRRMATISKFKEKTRTLFSNDNE